MEESTKENGKITLKREKATRNFLTYLFMKGLTKKENRMDTANMNGITAKFMKDNGLTDKKMALVCGEVLKVTHTSVNGKTERQKVMACIHG